jgi:hypothetical protein
MRVAFSLRSAARPSAYSGSGEFVAELDGEAAGGFVIESGLVVGEGEAGAEGGRGKEAIWAARALARSSSSNWGATAWIRPARRASSV